MSYIPINAKSEITGTYSEPAAPYSGGTYRQTYNNAYIEKLEELVNTKLNALSTRHNVFVVLQNDMTVQTGQTTKITNWTILEDSADTFSGPDSYYQIPESGVWSFNFSAYRSLESTLLKLSVVIEKASDGSTESYFGEFTNNDRGLQYIVPSRHFDAGDKVYCYVYTDTTQNIQKSYLFPTSGYDKVYRTYFSAVQLTAS